MSEPSDFVPHVVTGVTTLGASGGLIRWLLGRHFETLDKTFETLGKTIDSFRLSIEKLDSRLQSQAENAARKDEKIAGLEQSIADMKERVDGQGKHYNEKFERLEDIIRSAKPTHKR